MSVELIAIGLQIAITALGGFLFLKFYKREKKEILSKINIDDIKSEIEAVVHQNLQGAIDAISEAFEGILTQPTVKKAFSIIGSQGGEAKAENSLIDKMAVDMLDSPQFSSYRMAAEMLGLDIEGYIEQHGAMKTINAITQFARMAGIDLTQINLGDLSKPGGGGGGSDNPYFRR